MTTEITATKRKLIMREIALHDGLQVSYQSLMAIANRYHTPLPETRKLLMAVGYTVEDPPAAAPRPSAPPPAAKPPAVPAEVVATILSGGIYKIVDPDPAVDPSQVFVVTTLDKFTREREAIRKLLKGIA